MKKKYPDNVIPFPTLKEQEEKKIEKTLNDISNDCVECSHYLMEVLEEFIKTGQVSEPLMDMNFRDEIAYLEYGKKYAELTPGQKREVDCENDWAQPDITY